MHLYCCNKSITFVKPSEVEIFHSKTNFKKIEIYLYFVCLPAGLPAVRPGCARCMAPDFSHNKGNHVGFTKLLFRLRFVHCAMVISFIINSNRLIFLLETKVLTFHKGADIQHSMQGVKM